MTGRKLFQHIGKGYLAVLLIFTVLLGVFFYISGYRMMKSGFEQEAGQALDQFVKKTDIRLSMMKETAARLVKEDAVASFAASWETEENIALVQEAIRKNAGGFPQEGMSVYVSKLESSLDRVVGAEQAEGAYDFLTSFQFGNGSSEGIKQYFTRSENSGKVFVRYCVKSSVRNTNSLFLVQREMIGERPIYVICVLDVDAIIGAQVYRGGSIAVLDGQNIVCNIGANTLNTTDGIHNILEKYEVGTLQNRTASGDGYIYRIGASDIYRWNYILAVPTSALGEGAVQIFLTVLAVCFVLLALGWGLLLLLTKWVYRPFDRLLRRFPGYQATLADEDFFVKEALSAMEQERETLTAQVAADQVPLKTAFLKDLLFGLVSGEQFVEQAPKFALSGLSGPFRVVLLELVDYELLVETFPSETIEEMKRQVEEFLNDQLKEQIVHRVLNLDAKRLAVVSRGAEVRSLRELLMDMVMMVEGSFDVEIAGAIGEDCDDLAEVAASFASSCRIMENRVSLGSRNAVVTEEDVNVANSGGFYYPLDVERELITAVIRAHAEETDRIIDHILHENFKNRKLPKDRINAFAFAIAATLNRILESLNKSAEEVFGDGNIVFLDLKLCKGPEELGEKIHELFQMVIKHINVENKIAEDDLSDQLLSYIHSHYNEDISLLDIGGHFNLSQCYTSTLFKDATGENFKDYLSRYRIKKAKEILGKDPSIKNNELAKMIGCNTVATLFRLFNKYEGMSPGQYVKSLKQ